VVVALAPGLTLIQAAPSGTIRFTTEPTSTDSAMPTWLQRVGTPFSIAAVDAGTGEALTAFSPPLGVDYALSPAEVEALGGDLGRAKLAYERDGAWFAVPCSVAPGATLSCTLTHLSTFALVGVQASGGALDFDVEGGHAFRQANGFDGAGERGFVVVDDGQAAFWSEFQRWGGVDRLGYPISNRFEFKGYWTQAFQKLALQWRPDLQQAVPVNVLDEMNAAQLDRWLDTARQVPAAADTAADIGLDFPAVVSRHVALLAAYPELQAYYQDEPTALDQYGFPLAVKDYGPFVAVRLQRVTFQLRREPSGAQIVLGNAADIAKDAGLWPTDAAIPRELRAPVE